MNFHVHLKICGLSKFHAKYASFIIASWSKSSRTNERLDEKQTSSSTSQIRRNRNPICRSWNRTGTDARSHDRAFRRVSIVDYRGNEVLDTYVRPTQPVMDYRAAVTGIGPQNLWTAPSSQQVRDHVSGLLRDRIVIGHSLWHHFSLIGISHSALHTRDVALFLPFRRALGCRGMVPLSHLVTHLMRRRIGFGYENPVEDARAALDLFRSYEEPWEDVVIAGSWPCALPPSAFRDCFF